MDMLSELFRALLFILPSYFANSIPVLLGGGAPIDGKRKLADGQRLFGEGKTVRGLLSGVFAGVVVGALEGFILTGSPWDIYGTGVSTYILAGLLLGLGTMVGDLAGSFIKRRMGTSQGKPSLILDQLMFLVFALLFAYPLASALLTPAAVLFLFILTYFVHIGANVIANRLGLKKVPW